MSKMTYVEQSLRVSLGGWPRSSVRGIFPGRCPLRHGPSSTGVGIELLPL